MVELDAVFPSPTSEVLMALLAKCETMIGMQWVLASKSTPLLLTTSVFVAKHAVEGARLFHRPFRLSVTLLLSAKLTQ